MWLDAETVVTILGGGLAVLSGVVGTLGDTHEKVPDTAERAGEAKGASHRLTPLGRVAIAGIVAGAIVSGYGEIRKQARDRVDAEAATNRAKDILATARNLRDDARRLQQRSNDTLYLIETNLRITRRAADRIDAAAKTSAANLHVTERAASRIDVAAGTSAANLKTSRQALMQGLEIQKNVIEVVGETRQVARISGNTLATVNRELYPLNDVTAVFDAAFKATDPNLGSYGPRLRAYLHGAADRSFAETRLRGTIIEIDGPALPQPGEESAAFKALRLPRLRILVYKSMPAQEGFRLSTVDALKPHPVASLFIDVAEARRVSDTPHPETVTSCFPPTYNDCLLIGGLPDPLVVRKSGAITSIMDLLGSAMIIGPDPDSLRIVQKQTDFLRLSVESLTITVGQERLHFKVCGVGQGTLCPTPGLLRRVDRDGIPYLAYKVPPTIGKLLQAVEDDDWRGVPPVAATK